ncbi:hypothetical protein A3A42_00765 [Candidatus Kaiserbacteria bacterium RIFCSPLOWO2_01_FULL_55_25]|nr:MAG: hypothetical protein A3A42_00765 [Candidatus Kaiserbacteria bacterium RIFCSPLOWO2_01_FULL_55_25]
MDTSGMMNVGFKPEALKALKLATKILQKEAPTDPEAKKKFQELLDTGRKIKLHIESHDYFSAAMTGVFIRGLAYGLGVITASELEAIQTGKK